MRLLFLGLEDVFSIGITTPATVDSSTVAVGVVAFSGVGATGFIGWTPVGIVVKSEESGCWQFGHGRWGRGEDQAFFNNITATRSEAPTPGLPGLPF